MKPLPRPIHLQPYILPCARAIGHSFPILGLALSALYISLFSHVLLCFVSGPVEHFSEKGALDWIGRHRRLCDGTQN